MSDPDDAPVAPPGDLAAAPVEAAAVAATEEAGAEVVPISRARRHAATQAAVAEAAPAADDSPLGALLGPALQSIIGQLSGLAGADGVIRLGDDKESSRKQAAALVKGLGEGLGLAIRGALAAWATKIERGAVASPAAAATPPATRSADASKPDDDGTPPDA